MKAARENWFDGQPDLDPERLIFIDESGLSTKMARLRGWAPKGERCRAAIPHGHWKTVTFVGGLTLAGFSHRCCSTGRWTAKPSGPGASRCSRRPCGQVTSSSWTIWPPTRSLVSGKLLKPAARTLLYLPPYSPDLNPIENAFAKLKAHVRKAAARTLEALERAAADALQTFKPDECANFFAHAGYGCD